MAILREIQSWATVALGIGFVIFIHELGHFLVAKWNGVKVLKFSLGFGPALVSYRRGMGLRLGSSARAYADLVRADREGRPTRDLNAVGETEYALRALPLGGAVHMLGEGVEEGDRSDDPRAYANRPVFARMAIISAGVVMNLLLGWACFTFLGLRGGEETPAVLGMVFAGHPAYDAGLRAGDRIVAIDGRRDVSFDELKRAVILSGSGQRLGLAVERPGESGPLTIEVRPARGAHADVPTIGIAPADALTLAKPPYRKPTGAAGAPKGELKDGDRVVAVGPAGGPAVTVETSAALQAELTRLRDQPVDVKIARDEDPKQPGRSVRELVVTLPPTRMLDFGFRAEPGPIVGFRPGSRGAAAGLQVGDRILKVDGREYDPLRLPLDLYDHAGRELTLEVAHGEGAQAQVRTLRVTPDDTPPAPVALDALDAAGLGFAYEVRPRIAAVAEGSPAARAGLRAGNLIRAVTFTLPGEPSTTAATSKPREPETETLTLDPPKDSWIAAFYQAQLLPEPKLSLTIQGSETPVALAAEPAEGWYSTRRGLQFRELSQPVPPLGVVAAVQRGARRTLDSIVDVYATISGLLQRRLGRNAVGGPIKIFDVAYRAAAQGLDLFIPFLGFLSVNLAVINFLPIFPLDGGQLLFLIAEKVRGKPLPERVHVPLMFAGLAFVLALILFVSVNDVRGLIWPTR